MSFIIFQIAKTPLQAIKTRSLKSRKIDMFPTSFFQAIQARKMSFMIFSSENSPFQAIKTRSSKSRTIDIFPKELTHGFDFKMAIFPTFFFQTIQYRKMSFMIFQNKKTPFYARKTKSVESRKIDIFPKGLTHDFGPKMAILTTFFQAIQARKMSFIIFQNVKNAFLGYKNKKCKKSKNSHFS